VTRNAVDVPVCTYNRKRLISAEWQGRAIGPNSKNLPVEVGPRWLNAECYRSPQLTELVSILIPAYKAEAFIAETVRSARDQTWPRKEIIIVDDGSPDRTYEAAKRLESSEVKVVRQENGGAPSARNKAFGLAQGEYIQWLDADDVLHPDKIRWQLEGAESGLSSRTLITAAWGKFFYRTDKAEFSPDNLWRDHDPIDWIVTKFRDNVWMNPAVWLVSRRLTELAGPWDSRLARSGDDDGEYICRVVAESDRVRFVREAICYYRVGMVGSLNWNMETNEQSLQSLALSLTTSIHHLLRLEDSQRTRKAALRHLHSFLDYFYASDDRFYAELNAVARDLLGQELPRPSVSWKYRPLELLTGPRFTRKVITNWRVVKPLLRRRYEGFFYRDSQEAVHRSG
jgi:glycosyltransferase involved in cell wall biosynthesis